MTEVEYNISQGLGEGWVKVGAARYEERGLGKLVEG